MLRFNPNEKQLGLIAGALRIAAEVYEKDAQTCNAAGDARSAAQFKQQAIEARALCEWIEA